MAGRCSPPLIPRPKNASSARSSPTDVWPCAFGLKAERVESFVSLVLLVVKCARMSHICWFAVSVCTVLLFLFRRLYWSILYDTVYGLAFACAVAFCDCFGVGKPLYDRKISTLHQICNAPVSSCKSRVALWTLMNWVKILCHCCSSKLWLRIVLVLASPWGLRLAILRLIPESVKDVYIDIRYHKMLRKALTSKALKASLCWGVLSNFCSSKRSMFFYTNSLFGRVFWYQCW